MGLGGGFESGYRLLGGGRMGWVYLREQETRRCRGGVGGKESEWKTY